MPAILTDSIWGVLPHSYAGSAPMLADFGLKRCRRATRVTAAGVSRRIEEDWE